MGALLDFILPRACHICGENLNKGERYLCRGCLDKLPRTGYHRIQDNPMERRFMGAVRYVRGTGVYFYNPGSELAGVLHDLKYRHFRDLGRYMGELMARELMNSGFLYDIDVLVPVPMHWWKKAGRGYNQAEQLCIGLGNAAGIPVDTSLKAARPHKTQTKLSHSARLYNTEGIFAVPDVTTLRGRHILLVDDVCTTGGTLTSAANTLTAAVPGCRVSLLSLCVTF